MTMPQFRVKNKTSTPVIPTGVYTHMPIPLGWDIRYKNFADKQRKKQ